MNETLRQRAELALSTEHVGNQEWKALVREMLTVGLFGDDTITDEMRSAGVEPLKDYEPGCQLPEDTVAAICVAMFHARPKT